MIIDLLVYRDKNVVEPFREDLAALGDDGQSQKEARDDHVYMDATGFGMGSCCLQVTMLGQDITQARELYDQLTAFCPVMVCIEMRYFDRIDEKFIYLYDRSL